MKSERWKFSSLLIFRTVYASLKLIIFPFYILYLTKYLFCFFFLFYISFNAFPYYLCISKSSNWSNLNCNSWHISFVFIISFIYDSWNIFVFFLGHKFKLLPYHYCRWTSQRLEDNVTFFFFFHEKVLFTDEAFFTYHFFVCIQDHLKAVTQVYSNSFFFICHKM